MVGFRVWRGIGLRKLRVLGVWGSRFGACVFQGEGLGLRVSGLSGYKYTRGFGYQDATIAGFLARPGALSRF